ncbi:MAG: metallophosphoesterase [Oscillospiraceae bacterium]|nr:metallophosphoesterase [Oscillospiraceae bacterium]
MIYYTSDQHFGHDSIIKSCSRPFSSTEEMDECLIANWNETVGRNDEVYILGDFMYRNRKPPEEYLRRLNGKKHLFLGNHDRHWFEKVRPARWFERVETMYFYEYGERKAALCHYPMMSWPGGRGTYVLSHRNETLIVHCDAGISRSAGVAAAIGKCCNGDDRAFFRGGRYCPNMWCYRKTMAALSQLMPHRKAKAAGKGESL